MDVTFQSLGFKLMISLIYSFLILLLAGTASSGSELFFYNDVIMKRSFVYVFELPDEEEGQTYGKTKSFLIDLPKEINIRMASFLDNHSLLKLSYSSKSLRFCEDFYLSHIRVATKLRKAIKDCAVLSNLEKILLKCFILPKKHSIRWRSL